ncbi:unnamed protein product [Meloidogyne enterolobii]|uniref:Uncharacterized protein n=1 Tax=Meloidogyne enterolobii TaxID=390850 RepID=A0ACB1AQV6_MELEN
MSWKIGCLYYLLLSFIIKRVLLTSRYILFNFLLLFCYIRTSRKTTIIRINKMGK